MPGLLALYRSDLVIRRGLHLVAAGIIGAAGVVWATQPSLSPPPGVDLSFERAAHQWAPVVGAVLAGIGLLVVAWRYLFIRRILTRGITVKGLVVDLEVVSTTVGNSSNSPAMRRPKRHAYFATIRYAVHGIECEVCLRMPNSGFVFGLVKGRETDLLVLDWKPGQPLIRSVYLGKK